MTGNLAYILGVIGGDGTIFIKKGKQYTISISDKCKEFHVNIIQKIFSNIFDYISSMEFAKKRNTWYSVIRSRNIAEFFNKFYSTGRRKTYSDGIPKQILNCNKRSIMLSHIAGWLDSDGTSFVKTYRKKSGIYKYPCIKIELVNKNILENLNRISKKTGLIPAKIIYAKRNYRKNQKPRYCICWNGIKKCSILAKYMRHPSKLNKLKINISSSKRPI